MSDATMPLFAAEAVKVLSVSELTAAVKGTLEDGFHSVWVSGEIAALSRPPSGHVYLTLKDSGAQLGAIIWRSVMFRLPFEPAVGMEVIVRGGLNVYAPKGEYRLHIDEMQPKGLGARELALRQLKEKLHKLGYFDARRKKPLPRFPRRIGLVTSASGAAVRDMLEILGRRWPVAEVWVCATRVQGNGAANEIAAALRLLGRMAGLDVIIVGRGGGSTEDLWAFNSEVVAQAIFQCRFPIVSAVGHEIDVTIADLVADFRAATPSEAAERTTPDLRDLLKEFRDFRERLRIKIVRRFELSKARLADLEQRRTFRLPFERIRDGERRIDDWGERLERSIQQKITRARDQLQSRAARLETLSPLNVLGRGYSLTRRVADLTVVRTPDQVRSGDMVVTQLQQGRLFSRVEDGPVNPGPP
jgi:exodeoxyribonuclease VII large subunit